MNDPLTEAQKEAMRQQRICPKYGKAEMRPTYEPYELRCWKCGFWWDDYAGKEVDINQIFNFVDWSRWDED